MPANKYIFTSTIYNPNEYGFLYQFVDNSNWTENYHLRLMQQPQILRLFSAIASNHSSIQLDDIQTFVSLSTCDTDNDGIPDYFDLDSDK